LPIANGKKKKSKSFFFAPSPPQKQRLGGVSKGHNYVHNGGQCAAGDGGDGAGAE
jgi:hypothetical protein